MTTSSARLSSHAVSTYKAFCKFFASFPAMSSRPRRQAVAEGVSLLVLLLCSSPQAFSQACTGLCLQQVQCASNGTTSISGTVYAPNGTDPVANALVYVPNGGPAPDYGVVAMAPGAANGGPTVTGSPLVSTTTAATGTFTLPNMPVGTDIPLLIQVGKWQRMATIANVAECTNTALGQSTTTLAYENGQYSSVDAFLKSGL